MNPLERWKASVARLDRDRGLWFCETCEKCTTILEKHVGHDLTHFRLEDVHEAMKNHLPVVWAKGEQR
jgi:hypothetical protein